MNLTAAYFQNKNQCSSYNLNRTQLKMYTAEEKKYGNNVDIQMACASDKTLLLKSFIDSESVALEYQFQGQLYPMLHYKIKSLSKSAFKGFSEDDICHFFFHYLRLGEFIIPKESVFELYKKALVEAMLLMHENNYIVYNIKPYVLFLTFNALDKNDTDKVLQTNYEDYCKMYEFVTLCSSYISYPTMRKKRERFIKFTQDRFVFERITSRFQYFFKDASKDFNTFSFELSGSLIVLLLSMDSNSKQLLYKLHKSSLPRKQVWLLGSFYKAFQTTDAHRLILSDLRDTYPEEWIDVYA